MSQQRTPEQVPVYVMGKRYDLPATLTIMKAIEYAGYRYVRGAGCRGGVCGACGTVYRKPGDYRIRVGLACQTLVEAGMHLAQIPFFPAPRSSYDWRAASPDGDTIASLYPELFRCVACNACTKACPMGVPVMDYVAALKRGDVEGASRMSFDCIQCGLCTARCMGELSQYHMAQVARRLYGGKLAPRPKHVDDMADKIASGHFRERLEGLRGMRREELSDLYAGLEQEPHQAPEDWKPADTIGL